MSVDRFTYLEKIIQDCEVRFSVVYTSKYYNKTIEDYSAESNLTSPFSFATTQLQSRTDHPARKPHLKNLSEFFPAPISIRYSPRSQFLSLTLCAFSENSTQSFESEDEGPPLHNIYLYTYIPPLFLSYTIHIIHSLPTLRARVGVGTRARLELDFSASHCLLYMLGE